MVRTCCVDSCLADKTPNVNLHRFPTADPERRRQWLLALDMDADTPVHILGKLLVCRKHFLMDDYYDSFVHLGSRGRVLKPGAVPTQFLPPRTSEEGQVSAGDQLVSETERERETRFQDIKLILNNINVMINNRITFIEKLNVC